MERIVIVGNGIAGLSAARAIRKKNKSVEVLMISDEKYLTYDRTLLSDYLSDTRDEVIFTLEDAAWYKENNITLKLGARVEKIKSKSKLLITNENEAIPYDKLILANGSSNFIPPIPGADKKGVFSLKDLDDAKEIIMEARLLKRCAIIGGGILGFEAAFELPELGVDVTVICSADRVIERQLDRGASDHVKNKILGHDVHLTFGSRAVEIIGDASVMGVKLANGKIVDCDFVLISTGIKPNTGICADTSIEFNRGIIVDEHMKTNVEDIYAAGDITEFEGMVYGIWSASEMQGAIAGENAVGGHKKFHSFIPSNDFDAFSIKFFSIGELEQYNCNEYCSYIIDEHCKAIYKKLMFRNNQLVGGILIGDFMDKQMIIDGINKKAKKKEFMKHFHQ